jgi:hypothetical protein
MVASTLITAMDHTTSYYDYVYMPINRFDDFWSTRVMAAVACDLAATIPLAATSAPSTLHSTPRLQLQATAGPAGTCCVRAKNSCWLLMWTATHGSMQL